MGAPGFCWDAEKLRSMGEMAGTEKKRSDLFQIKVAEKGKKW